MLLCAPAQASSAPTGFLTLSVRPLPTRKLLRRDSEGLASGCPAPRGHARTEGHASPAADPARQHITVALAPGSPHWGLVSCSYSDITPGPPFLVAAPQKPPHTHRLHTDTAGHCQGAGTIIGGGGV